MVTKYWWKGNVAAAHAAGYSSAGSTPTHVGRRRGMLRLNTLVAVAALAAAALVLNNTALRPDPKLEAWSLQGCPVKILDLTTTMEAQYQVLQMQEAAPGSFAAALPSIDCTHPCRRTFCAGPPAPCPRASAPAIDGKK